MNRKQRREMMRQMQSEDLNLEVVHPHAAGIDIGNAVRDYLPKNSLYSGWHRNWVGKPRYGRYLSRE
jgi:hypothetical protein